MDVNNNALPRRRVIRRRAPPPLEGYYYYLSLLKAIVQFLSYIICMIIVAGIEIRIAEMINSSPWANRSLAHPREPFFLNRMDEFFLRMDFFQLDAIQEFTRDNATKSKEVEGSPNEEQAVDDGQGVDDNTLLSLLGEELEVVILPLTELRAVNLTGMRANNEEDRMAIINM